MPRINCSITNCSHNNEKVCYANVINVGGKSATKDSETSCGSFLDIASYGSLTNNVNQEGSECTAITCNVATCTYNGGNLCHADAIQVSGENANIYTEANCITFRNQ